MENNEYWSCKDLQGSLYLAPSQIRTCCQRFFVDGKQQGDVVLLDIDNGDEVSIEGIFKAKKDLIKKINDKERTPCYKCPYLQKKNWGANPTLQIKHLSLEYHSICNLKCTYCSEEYFGGKKVQYDLIQLIKELINNKILEGCKSIVWGGGEPTLDSEFNNVLQVIIEELKPSYIRFFTNSVKYNETIQELLDQDRIYITTSIDAGSEQTYKKIRGFNRISRVFENLKKYSNNNPKKVTVKYIFTEGNHSTNEISEFIRRVQENDLTKCNFQISFDFTIEYISTEIMLAIIKMYADLLELGAASVFLDDLIWQRISRTWQIDTELKSLLLQAKLLDIIAEPNLHKEVIIWGTGTISDNVVEKSSFFKSAKVSFFVTSDLEQINLGFKKVFGEKIKVFPSTYLLESDLPIVAAAAQQVPLIISEMAKLGIPESRLIKKLII
jgi:organic radical activating enzyme